MTKLAALTLLFALSMNLCGCFAFRGQEHNFGQIEGVVLDSATQQPVAGASVWLRRSVLAKPLELPPRLTKTEWYVESDKNGTFCFDHLAQDKYDLHFSAVGYCKFVQFIDAELDSAIRIRVSLHSCAADSSRILILNHTKDRERELATLEGTVLDSTTNEPVVGATILLKGTRMGDATDPEGHFCVRRIPNGTYDVKITAVRYDRVLLTGILFKAGTTVSIVVQLKLSPYLWDKVLRPNN